MKLIAATIAIAFVVQVALAEPLGHRNKRSEDIVPQMKKMITGGRKVMVSLETVVKALMPKIPQTEDYSKYRSEFQGLLDELKIFNTPSYSCDMMSLNILSLFARYMQTLKVEDTPAAQNLYRLYEESGGQQLNIELMEWHDILSKSNFDVKTTAAENQQFAEFLANGC